MDSLTQAALGAAIGEALLGKKEGRKGLVIGAIVATIPDLDIILLPFLEPLERLSMHRGYSHSILFSILGGLLISYFLSKRSWLKETSFRRLFLFSWLCLFTHMLLDAFTPYGTLLFLPFSDERVGFDSINIVDPFYTVPLLVGLFFTDKYRSRKVAFSRPNYIGLFVSSAYLLGTLGVKSIVNNRFEKQLHQEKISYEKLLSEPVGVASLRWYGVARSKDGFFMGDYSFWKDNEIQFTYFPTNDSLLQNVDSHLVDRMKWFAKDYYHVVSEDNMILFYNMQVDMQGIYEVNGRLAPTKGYFTIQDDEMGNYILRSGRHGK